ncbi:MAG: sulfatase, partial [Acidobacteria bacterium]|nr:sulfatase [Acidobacteriota bacterium]
MKGSLTLLFLLALLPRALCAANVILVSIDTLRADRLSCYGYQGNKTPNIDRWAREGIRFERAYTEYPLTLPAHATLFTGAYPLAHGVLENVGFSLDSRLATLAEVFKRNGYSTGAFIGSYVLSSRFGIARGFDTYDEEFPVSAEDVVSATALERPAQEVATRFLKWLEGRRGGDFFAFVHFYDPHMPRPNGYDWEVSQVDRGIGLIDQYLRRNDLLSNTHIFLVSDHGESLGEHSESGHGLSLYDSTLHVPLVIRPVAGVAPGRRVISQTVSLADVMPTIMQIAGPMGSPRPQPGPASAAAM